jgi:hypothetical protein
MNLVKIIKCREKITQDYTHKIPENALEIIINEMQNYLHTLGSTSANRTWV